jgi:hypothetical protein
MPKKLVTEIFNGYMSKMKESMGIGTGRADAAPAQPADQAAIAGAAPVGGAPSAVPAA